MKLAFALVALAAAAAQSAAPDTPAGKALRAWLDAFNSADRARVTAFFDKYQPTKKDRIEGLLSFREQTGGFDLIRVEKSEPLHIEALVKEHEGENYARFQLELTSAQPATVKQIGINIVPHPAGLPEAPRLPLSDAVRAVDAKAADLAAHDKFSGVVLVAHDGAIAFEKAYGKADRDKQTPNTNDTQFRIGSMNKMFTATAVLQLAGEGKIDLSAPLSRYLPGYPNRGLASQVTIRHLLTHTGGTGDIFTPEYDAHRLELRELQDYVKLFGSRDLAFPPGSKWAYSNYGFVLLGVVVEKVSGLSYYDYVRRNIFEPAGMRSTDSLPESQSVAHRSVGYLRKDGAWASNADTLPWRGTSAGGGYSTAEDLFRFAQALTSGKLVKPELFKLMTSSQTSDVPDAPHYGFGMTVQEEPHRQFGHGGGAPGMNGELRIYPGSNTVIVVLANLDPPAATRLADFLDARMSFD